MRTVILAIITLSLVFACGEEPGPGPDQGNGGQGDSGATMLESRPGERVLLDALRHGAGWRLTLSPPPQPRDGFEAVEVVLEKDDAEITRLPVAELPKTLDLPSGGRLRAFLRDASGRKIASSLDLP